MFDPKRQLWNHLELLRVIKLTDERYIKKTLRVSSLLEGIILFNPSVEFLLLPIVVVLVRLDEVLVSMWKQEASNDA